MIAEELVISEVLNASRAARLNGLMKHLKRNSALEDNQKQVLLAEAAETFVPEELDEAIRSEYERRCAFGERMNTEFMSSAKWIKLLREAGMILPPNQSARGAFQGECPTIRQAEADIIFHKVLHNCDRGSQRLTFELFCKALYLTAQALLPDLPGEAAFSEVLRHILECAPEPDHWSAAEVVELMLDARVLLILDHFKPALHDLFMTFCSRNLANPAKASPGGGLRRARERTVWKHTQETMILANHELTSCPSVLPPHRLDLSPLASPSKSDRCEMEVHCIPEPLGTCGVGTGSTGSAGGLSSLGGFATPVSSRGSSFQMQPPLTSSCLSTGDLCCPRSLTPWSEKRRSSPSSPPPGTDRLSRSVNSLSTANGGELWQDCPQANGAPVIHNRRQFMSVDQLLSWCRELKMMPSLLTRLEVVRIFKRAQGTGLHGSSHGSSVHGFLSRDAFVDAVGQLALEAYSKEPFCDEYPEPHDRIAAFLLDFLPGNSAEAHDRFLYGCSGRDR